MSPRSAVLLAILLTPLASGCGSDAASASTRGGAQNPNPPAEGIGPAGVGLEPRDTSGTGRGSMNPHGKGP